MYMYAVNRAYSSLLFRPPRFTSCLILPYRKLYTTPITTITGFSTPPQSNSSPPSASIPFMITSTTRQKLYELEYTEQEVDSLSPSQALFILANGYKPESYGAYVRTAFQQKLKNRDDQANELPQVIQLGDSGEIQLGGSGDISYGENNRNNNRNNNNNNNNIDIQPPPSNFPRNEPHMNDG